MPCALRLLIYQPLPQQLRTAHFSTMWLSKHYPQCTYINTLAKLKRLRESLSCDVDNNYNKFIACKAQFNIYYYYWTKISSTLVTPSWSKCQKFDQINEIKNANSLILLTRKHNKTNPNYCLSLWCFADCRVLQQILSLKLHLLAKSWCLRNTDRYYGYNHLTDGNYAQRYVCTAVDKIKQTRQQQKKIKQ